MSIQSEIVRIAKSQVGVIEVGGNNRGPKVREYQEATSLNPDDWAWCAAFCCWVLREALSTGEGRNFLGSKQASDWRCRYAGAWKWEEWAAARQLTVLSENNLAKAGDFVTYDFSHIGIVVEDQKTSRSNIITVEGNTNSEGARDSTTGDGVWQKSRKYTLIRRLIRLGVVAL